MVRGRESNVSERRRTPLVPPVWAGFTLGLQYALWRLLPGPRLVGEWWPSVGLGLVGVGLVLILYCAGLFHRSGTPIEPGRVSESLIIRGPYRWSRNPIYASMFVVLVGTAVWFGNATAFLPLVGFLWIISSQFVTLEEQMLIDRFGEEYHEYRSRVRRWF